MVRLFPLLALLVSAAAACSAAAQPTSPTTGTAAENNNNPPGAVGIKVSFRPSVAIVIGIIAMVFSLTILLIMYAKFCHPSSPPLPANTNAPVVQAEADAAAPATGGVPKQVVESLPFFRFATLRGARQGMECVVCLARFDEADLLRLLPRCRHAFHLACLDRWLESHASCPLCRAPIDADDDGAELGLKRAASARIVFGGGDDDGDGSVEGRSGRRNLLDIFVERVPSSRFHNNVVESSPCRRGEQEEDELELDRHRHRIVVSDAVFKSRWSELNSADLIALDTEMLRSFSSFPSPDYDEKLSPQAIRAATTTTTENRMLLGETTHQKHGGGSSVLAGVVRGSNLLSTGVRSVSEIVSLPRLRRAPMGEEHRRWLPIARRTVKWFAGRAKQDGEEEEGRVHVGPAAQV